MTQGLGCFRSARRLLLAVLLVGCAFAPAGAAAKSGSAGTPELSPRLAELARPEVRSLPPDVQARKLGVSADGPGSLLRLDGRVLVDVRFERGAISALDELGEAGARVVTPSRRYQTVTAAIAPGRLHELAAVPGVEGVSENRAPLLSGIGAECEGGWRISEGVSQLHAAAARSRHGVDGSGVTVGILSDSYDEAAFAAGGSGPVATHAAEDVATSDLPGSANPCAGEKAEVDVLQDFGFEASDEGRGMAQIVHDVAPGASLAFATAFLGELSFAENIERLAEPVSEAGAGADVLVDDVIYFEEPFFQDGPIAVAVDKVVGDGAAYFSAAGNNNLFEGTNEIASWEAPEFRDAGTCPGALLDLLPPGTGHCMDFDPGGETDTTFAITVSPGATLTLDLQWAEPWFGVETDLDAYLFDLADNLLAAEESDNVGQTQRPVELPEWENTTGSAKTVRLAINHCAGACNPQAEPDTIPTVKFALLQNGGGVTNTEYPVSGGGDVVGPTIFGHAAASGAVAVGAVPYNNANQMEKYSSRGPVVHHFGPVLGTTAAAPVAPPEGEEIAKPDLAATDCGATTFFAFLAGDGEWRFCGTSAAAPHAAAVAALQLEAEPLATVEEVRAAQTSTAVPVGPFGPDAMGAGLLQADLAIADLLPAAEIEIVQHPASRTADPTPTFGWAATTATEFTCTVDEVTPESCGPGPFTPEVPLPDGPHLFEVEGIDAPGAATFAFTVDTTPPGVAFTEQPAATSADSSPSFAFAPSEPASLTCSLDGAVPKPCKSPQAAGPLADGPHSFTITATDQAGNTGAATIGFAIDTAPFSPASVPMPPPSPQLLPPVTAPDARPPQTFFGARPPAVVRTRRSAVRLRFGFLADEPGARFECKVDRGPFRSCGSRLARRFGLGKHVLRVRARDEAGNVDPSPAVFRFRVVRVARALRHAG